MPLKPIFLIILILVLILSCTDNKLFLVNSLARFGNYTVHSNIAYGDDDAQQLDIYVPENLLNLSQSSLTTVVFFYGGCWGACSDLTKTDYRFIAEAFTANNIIAIIVDYRKFPTVLFKDIMSDAQHSIEWVSENIVRYGGNNQRIFLMGHSAGAHIASMLHFDEQYLKPTTHRNVKENIKGFIGLAGPYDFLPFTESYQAALFAPPDSYAQSQTILFVDGNEPPTLLLYGNKDTRVKRRNILSLTKAILAKNGRVETHFYDNIDHPGIIGALSIPLRSSQPIMKHIVNFISEH